MIKLQVIGNLGRDCIVKEVNGKNVINFSVAHTEKYKDRAGAQHEKTTWVECAYWTDRTAIAPYLTKGTMLYVEGIPEADAWVNRENNAVATLRLRVSTLQLLGKAPQANSPGGNSQAAPQNISGPAAPAASEAADDLPF
jgi:single-strand DNA-binding protein